MIWLMLVVIGTAWVKAEKHGYRLPENIKPMHYVLEIFTDMDQFRFDGEVWIKVECVDPTDKIFLHSKMLDIADKETTVKEILSDHELGSIDVRSVDFVEKDEFVIISLSEKLKAGVNYIIHLKFSGILKEDLAGYYRSSYVDQSTNTTKWLGVTQFEAIDARKAFPCFDEPAMKAMFTIRLAHHKNLKAISNMPLNNTLPYEKNADYVWSNFEESVPMSTYLVAFMISDFEYIESPPSSNNVTFRIWSRKDALSQTGFAQEFGPKVLEDYETYFDKKYPLPKQDMAAIPDFSAGAMENWGLITYRETALLYDEHVSSKISLQTVAIVIAHELAHQWFGNLVTMKWWTDLWLNEGFAEYIASWGVERLKPEWGYLKESMLDNARYVFDLDSLNTSHPVSISIGHPNEISQIFDNISYKKGSLLLRMMHLFLGDSFAEGVRNYLKKYSYKNAEQDDLWECLTDAAHNDSILDTNLTVKMIMDTWTLQTGYPLVTIERDYARGSAKLKQNRHFRVEHEVGVAKDTSCWRIPITYTTQEIRNFENTSPKLWMTCENLDSVELSNLTPDSWIILNVDVAGLYRVQYDEQNWKLLSKTLNSDNYTDISVMNRGDLIMTALDLAWSGDLSYDIAIPLVRYLEREKEWLPWKTGLVKLKSLANLLGRTSSYSYYKQFMTQLITPIYRNFRNLTNIPTDMEKLKLHTYISKWAAELDLGDTLNQIHDLMYQWMAEKDPDNNNPIPKELKENVYCAAVWYGGARIWEFLYKRYEMSNVGAEKSIILSSLGCSRDVWILNRYLEWSIDYNSSIRKQDSPSVFLSIARQHVGYYVACDFLKRRINDIYSYNFGTTSRLGRYFQSCADGIIYKDELKQWKEFVAANQQYLKKSHIAADQSIENALANTKWYYRNYANIAKIMKA